MTTDTPAPPQPLAPQAQCWALKLPLGYTVCGYCWRNEVFTCRKAGGKGDE